jgi:hypothetical protein
VSQAVLRCARCEREAPLPSTPAFLLWEHADIDPRDLLDEIEAHLLICPECREEERSGEDIGGEG